jgi:hypothetical protein
LRIPFQSVCLALALGGPLAAEEITITNTTAQPWMLVWSAGLPGAENNTQFIEGSATLRVAFETPGIQWARLYDSGKRSDCVLQVTHGGVPVRTVVEVLPEWGEEASVRRVVVKTSDRTVTLLGAFEDHRPRHASQKYLHWRAKEGARAPLPEPKSAKTLMFDAPAPKL